MYLLQTSFWRRDSGLEIVAAEKEDIDKLMSFKDQWLIDEAD